MSTGGEGNGVTVSSPAATIDGGDLLRRRQQLHALFTLVLSFFGLIAGIAAIPWVGFHAIDFLMLVVMYALTMTGVAVGFHILLSHRGFEAPSAVRVTLAILGSMAGQGPPLYWATNHRLHHGSSDGEGDLHSPWVEADGRALSRLRGLWHAHVGWMFDHAPANPLRFSKDLLRNAALTRTSQLYYLWLVLGVVLPALAGLALAGLRGLFSGLVWGGLARMCLVQHATFAGNSICHFLGEHTYDTGDRSTNVLWLTIPTWGGAMHNTHHAFPSSPVVGFRWWHLDLGGWIVCGLERLGLAASLRVPSEDQRQAALVRGRRA
jgi:stearoyl-CoA desaturase (delta-9 desaturase)